MIASAMIVTLAIVVLAIGLVLFVTRWMNILILAVAAMTLTLVFRMFANKCYKNVIQS